jgi:hypothetical protein
VALEIAEWPTGVSDLRGCESIGEWPTGVSDLLPGCDRSGNGRQECRAYGDAFDWGMSDRSVGPTGILPVVPIALIGDFGKSESRLADREN